MRLSLFLAVNFAFALDWRIKKAAFNDRNEKYEAIMAKIDSADTFDEIQVRSVLVQSRRTSPVPGLDNYEFTIREIILITVRCLGYFQVIDRN